MKNVVTKIFGWKLSPPWKLAFSHFGKYRCKAKLERGKGKKMLETIIPCKRVDGA